MKKFISKKEKQKKERRNQILVGIFLSVLMLFSVIGFAIQFGPRDSENAGQEERIIYNGIEFTYVNGFWVAGGFAFRYNPYEVPDISPSGDELKDIFSYQEKPLYIYSENPDAEREISINLRMVAEKLIPACPSGQYWIECPEENLIKSCDDDNFIIIRESTNSVIRQENKCVFIEGLPDELPKLADQFLFKILGVR